MLTAGDVKYYSSLKQKKYREREEKFLIEGFHLVEECLSSPYEIECIISSGSIEKKKNNRIFETAGKKKIAHYTLKEKSFNKLTETEATQGIIAVVKRRKSASVTSLRNENPIVALDRITDPGNLGTIIRTSYWFGINALLVSENSADIHNSKVIRSAQGALFHVNIINNINLSGALAELENSGYSVYLMDVKSEKTLDKIDKRKKSVFVFGNEADGISVELLKQGFESVKINGYSNCESLNVAVSCGIVLHDFKSFK
jgi:TrmH family RNA methyltransferase